MVQVKHSDEQVWAGTGGAATRHRPKLVFVTQAGAIHDFQGASIPGIARVAHEDYKKNGKWSFTSWTLQLAPGVAAWTNEGGTLRELSGASDARLKYHALSSWEEVPADLHFIVRHFLPKTTARLDENARPV